MSRRLPRARLSADPRPGRRPTSGCAAPGRLRRATWPWRSTRSTRTSSTATPGTRTSAGLLVQQAYGIPLVVTVHSLEPLRPWKREQLGGGYDLSTWVERTALESADAVIAVQPGDARRRAAPTSTSPPERIHVIHNGIDADFCAARCRRPTCWRATASTRRTPYVLFVGRITRQKGIVHLVRAIRHLDPGIGVVLCAGQPDTPEIAARDGGGGRGGAGAIGPASSGSRRC